MPRAIKRFYASFFCLFFSCLVCLAPVQRANASLTGCFIRAQEIAQNLILSLSLSKEKKEKAKTEVYESMDSTREKSLDSVDTAHLKADLISVIPLEHTISQETREDKNATTVKKESHNSETLDNNYTQNLIISDRPQTKNAIIAHVEPLEESPQQSMSLDFFPSEPGERNLSKLNFDILKPSKLAEEQVAESDNELFRIIYSDDAYIGGDFFEKLKTWLEKDNDSSSLTRQKVFLTDLYGLLDMESLKNFHRNIDLLHYSKTARNKLFAPLIIAREVFEKDEQNEIDLIIMATLKNWLERKNSVEDNAEQNTLLLAELYSNATPDAIEGLYSAAQRLSYTNQARKKLLHLFIHLDFVKAYFDSKSYYQKIIPQFADRVSELSTQLLDTKTFFELGTKLINKTFFMMAKKIKKISLSNDVDQITKRKNEITRLNLLSIIDDLVYKKRLLNKREAYHTYELLKDDSMVDEVM